MHPRSLRQRPASRSLSAAWLAASFILACGARSSLGDDTGESFTPGASGPDASTRDASPGGRDAAACPPTGPDWTPSIVFEAPASYAVAADPACGVIVVLADAARRIHIMTPSAGSWADEITPWIGTGVAAASEGAELHVLYFDERGLEHATRSDPKPELVDADAISQGEVFVDTAGAVHAIYTAKSRDHAYGGAHYAVKRGGWIREEVDPRFTSDPSLAVDRDGTIYAAYQYVTNQEVHGCALARRSSTGWTLLDMDQIDQDSWSTESCTCGVARDGTFHVAYGGYRAEGTVLRHAFGVFDALQLESVDRTAAYGTFPWAAALDNRGVLHAAYSGADDPQPPLKVAVLEGASTILETVPATSGVGGVLVAIDAADVTHVLDYEEGHLVHRARSPR